ncbi:MAG: ATP-binding protein [Nitrospira sp.]
MNEHTIVIPKWWNLDGLLKWGSTLFCSPHADRYYIDFKDMGWMEPFPLLFLSSSILRFKAMRPESEFLHKNFQQHTYAAHMGLFKSLNIDFGNKPGEAKGSDNYLPINILSIRDLQKKAINETIHIGQLLENHAKQLARLLTQEDNSNLADTLTYTLREIMRNAVEHSNSDSFLYCGQYWPTKNVVQIAILDSGIGVRESLSRNPKIRITSDEHALRLSTLPGISGKPCSSAIEEYDGWENSGYGLYLTKRLCTTGGSFFICSGNKGLYSKPNKNETYLDANFQGTALRLSLDKNSTSSLKTALRQFRIDGEEIAKKFDADSPKASASSRGIISRKNTK